MELSKEEFLEYLTKLEEKHKETKTHYHPLKGLSKTEIADYISSDLYPIRIKVAESGTKVPTNSRDWQVWKCFYERGLNIINIVNLVNWTESTIRNGLYKTNVKIKKHRK